MGAVNAEAFARPGVRERAMGYGWAKPIGHPSQPTRTGGIRNPQQHLIKPDEVIIRFGQKRLAWTDDQGKEHPIGLSHRGLIGGALEGEWWLELAEFTKVARYANAKSIPISAAISALCVVPGEWSDLDVVVSARLFAPLLAYRGEPSPADSKGTHYPVVKDLDGGEIVQLYIPGLGNGDVVRNALMHSPPTFLHQGWH